MMRLLSSILKCVFILSFTFGNLNGDENFEDLIQNTNFSSRSRLFEIARSGNPKTIEVLQQVRFAPKNMRWGEFQNLYGYPMSLDPRGEVAANEMLLDLALSIAGDKEAFERVVYPLESLGNQTEGNMELVKLNALNSMTIIDNDLSHRYLADLLFDYERTVMGEPISVKAAVALHSIYMPDIESSGYDWPIEDQRDIQGLLSHWRKWAFATYRIHDRSQEEISENLDSRASSNVSTLEDIKSTESEKRNAAASATLNKSNYFAPFSFVIFLLITVISIGGGFYLLCRNKKVN